MGAMLLVLVRRRQASRPWGAPTKPPPTNLPTPFVFVSAWCVMACVRRVRGLFVWRERSLTPFCVGAMALKQNPADRSHFNPRTSVPRKIQQIAWISCLNTRLK